MLHFAGLDNGKVIYGSSLRQTEMDLFEEIDIPQDYCAALALRTNGSIFDSGNLMAGSVRYQRDFMDMFGQRVKENQSDSPCQVCSCEVDRDGNPRSVCRRCDMQPVKFRVTKFMLLSLTSTLARQC